MQTHEIAINNFERHIRHNPYPGRGFVIGPAPDREHWYMLYWIMGRSANSRNRRFVVEDGILRTVPVESGLITDASLIIYEAMLELPLRYLVSNGDQTRTIYETLKAGGTFDQALEKREREPDAPHYTSRISGLLDLRGPAPSLTLSILKANIANPALTDRYTYRPVPPPAGFGLGLTTYRGDGNPLPAFAGEPLLLPLQGGATELLDRYWEALNAENRVALAIKSISISSGASTIIVRNRF